MEEWGVESKRRRRKIFSEYEIRDRKWIMGDAVEGADFLFAEDMV